MDVPRCPARSCDPQGTQPQEETKMNRMNGNHGARDRARARGRLLRWVVAGAVALGGGSLAKMASAVDCAPPSPGEPTFVDDTCTDTRWNAPFIDVDEMRTPPVPHRYVHGGFTGTSALFAFYFPPAEQYQGRFIQGPVHP